MQPLFITQYQLVQKTRKIVFGFLETDVRADLTTPVAVYGNQSVHNKLEHVAFCYLAWLGEYAMKIPLVFEPRSSSLAELQKLYARVDATVYQFLEKYGDSLNEEITGIHNREGLVKATPAQVFTHVYTHEFHHKGQYMTMCRMLGHTPPETDLGRFFGGGQAGQ
jgi:uncharacterized damage-inducible protein DinB